MLLTKTPITTSNSPQYGAGVATLSNSNTSAKRMMRQWVVIFVTSVTQIRVTALQRKANK